MAKLISLYRDDGQNPLGKRELPLPFDENIAMVMKLPELNLNRLPSCLKSSEMELFLNKWKLLTATELNQSMRVTNTEVFQLIGQNVPCVGCRRSVERLFHKLMESGQGALYPISLNENGILELDPGVVAKQEISNLFILLKYYGSRLSTMVESISSKSRQTRRCPLHSLDAHRARPTGLQWQPLWDSMAQECREELTLVEADTLLDTLEAYLQKHRFCPECRLKVLRAYSLLVGEVEPSEEKGYKPLLFLGLKCCPAEKHIHVQCNTDLISLLIARAEPELVGSSRRERHAKTMEVAQEEVVTCVGICLLERLQRLAQRLREEEQMVDMLQFASLQAMRRSFEMAVESKRGVSQLELLCEELSREEAAQKQRKELKKLRRKKRRGKKETLTNANSEPMNDLHSLVDDKVDDDNDDDHDDESVKISTCLCDFTDEKFKSKSSTKNRVNNNNDNWPTSPSPIQSRDCSCYCSSSCSCSSITKHSASSQSLKCKDGSLKYPQDSGYCTTNSSNLTTPEGSDVACTEGLCNHSSGSPVQGQSGSNLLPEGHDLSDLYPPTNGHQCDYNRHEEGFSVNNKQIACPLHFKLRENCCSGRSLQQMLEEWRMDSDEDGDNEESSYIPVEEVQAFRKQQQHYNEQRLQLRNDLRLKFDRLCGRVPNI